MKKSKKEIEEEKRKKLDKKVTKQNQKLINEYSKTTAKRHVKEKNEPVFDKMIDKLQNDYAKQVVSNSSLEILKIVKTDEFQSQSNT